MRRRGLILEEPGPRSQSPSRTFGLKLISAFSSSPVTTLYVSSSLMFSISFNPSPLALVMLQALGRLTAPRIEGVHCPENSARSVALTHLSVGYCLWKDRLCLDLSDSGVYNLFGMLTHFRK